MNIKQNNSVSVQIKIVTTAPDVPTVKTTTTVTVDDNYTPQTCHRSSCKSIIYRPVIFHVCHKRKIIKSLRRGTGCVIPLTSHYSC